MCATEEASLNLDPMADHFALTMLADGSHRLDRALETIECMPRSSGFDYKDLVVFVATDFAICHRTPPHTRAYLASRINKARILLCRDVFGPGDLRHGLGYLFRLFFERQVGLCHNANAPALSVDHRDTPDLMFLHRLLATIEILSVSAGYRILPHIFLNRGAFRIETLSNDRAAEVAIRNDASQFARLLIDNRY
jgi:hypothetical protein